MANVRKATLNDSEAVASCLFLAMEDIVYHFIGEDDPEKAREFMLHFVEKGSNQYSYQNCFVAEEKMKVVAAINVYDGASLTELRQPVVEYIRAKFNQDFKPEDETESGEYYIDALGVDPSQRGKGIGTALLQFVINEYLSKRGQTLGLLVDETNSNARRLYVKLGFRNVGWRMLFGKKMEHLQIKG